MGTLDVGWTNYQWLQWPIHQTSNACCVTCKAQDLLCSWRPLELPLQQWSSSTCGTTLPGRILVLMCMHLCPVKKRFGRTQRHWKKSKTTCWKAFRRPTKRTRFSFLIKQSKPSKPDGTPRHRSKPAQLPPRQGQWSCHPKTKRRFESMSRIPTGNQLPQSIATMRSSTWLKWRFKCVALQVISTWGSCFAKEQKATGVDTFSPHWFELTQNTYSMYCDMYVYVYAYKKYCAVYITYKIS